MIRFIGWWILFLSIATATHVARETQSVNLDTRAQCEFVAQECSRCSQSCTPCP